MVEVAQRAPSGLASHPTPLFGSTTPNTNMFSNGNNNFRWNLGVVGWFAIYFIATKTDCRLLTRFWTKWGELRAGVVDCEQFLFCLCYFSAEKMKFMDNNLVLYNGLWSFSRLHHADKEWHFNTEAAQHFLHVIPIIHAYVNDFLVLAMLFKVLKGRDGQSNGVYNQSEDLPLDLSFSVIPDNISTAHSNVSTNDGKTPEESKQTSCNTGWHTLLPKSNSCTGLFWYSRPESDKRVSARISS